MQLSTCITETRTDSETLPCRQNNGTMSTTRWILGGMIVLPTKVIDRSNKSHYGTLCNKTTLCEYTFVGFLDFISSRGFNEYLCSVEVSDKLKNSRSSYVQNNDFWRRDIRTCSDALESVPKMTDHTQQDESSVEELEFYHKIPSQTPSKKRFRD